MFRLHFKQGSCSLVLVLLLLLFYRSESSTRTTLARSGIQTTVTYPGPDHNATYTKNVFTAFANDTKASWIWDGPSHNSSTCNMDIKVREDFIVKCPANKLRLIIVADNSYNFTLLGATGSGNSWSTANSFDITVTGITCSNFSPYPDQQISLYVDARNDIQGTTKCQSNPAGLAYTISQADCTCNVAGSYYNWQTCACSPCSTELQGCMTCSALTSTTVTCTSCATSKKWVLTNGVCVCASGKVSTVGCLSCVTPGAVCPACDTTSRFVLTGTGTCVCSSGYILSGTKCVTCSSVLSNCVTCSSSTNCSSCISTSYALVAATASCQLCNVVLSGCKTCTSETVCIACLNNSYVLMSPSCVPCSTPIIGCSTCSSTTMCTTCDTAGHFEKSGSKCRCQSGYTATATTCSSCDSQMTGCSICTSASVCTSCNTVANFEANGANGCTCKGGYVLVGTSCSTCISLMPGCSSCTSPTTCTNCDPALHLIPGAIGCVCGPGYISDGSGVCVTCMSIIDPNCLTCSSSTACTSCAVGFGVSGTATSCVTCTLIHPSCQDCSTGTVCTLCDATLNLVADATLGCVCIAPTSVSNGAGGCVSCTTNPGCLECASLTTCLVCNTGYYLNGLSNCSACDLGCNECSGSGACLVCDQHYFLSFGNCDPCTLAVTGCDTCTSGGACLTCDAVQHLQLGFGGASCECISGYYDNVGVCDLCSNPMPGCISCSVGTYCDACDPTLFLTNSAGSCICVALYAFNGGGVCELCSTLITNCISCSSMTTCTACDNLYGVILTPLPSAGNCDLCSTLIPNCNTCTDSSTCATCATGYTSDGVGGCQACSVTLAGCVECSSTAVCTVCSAVNQAPNAGGICTVCNLMMVGCQSCTSDTVCLTCNTAGGFDLSDTICACVAPLLFKTFTSTCQTCLSLQPQCQLCQSQTYCLDCADGSYLSGVAGSQTCAACPPGCLTCTSLTNCDSCDTAAHFTMSGTICDCQIGYSSMGVGLCGAVCGDGLVATEQACDDGNAVNGDGCDSTCHIQTNYDCFAFPGFPSICSYNKPLEITLGNLTKVPGSNSLVINIKIGPMLPDLSTMDFSQIISSNQPLTNPRFVVNADGSIAITYDYNQTLDSNTIQLQLSPAAVSENYFAVPSSYIDFSLESDDNLPLSYYNESVYEKEQEYDKAYKVGIALSYGVMAVGMFCDKVNGVELFGVWQIAFLSLSTINKVQPLLAPLMKLGIVNGFNSMVNFNTTTVPSRVSSLAYEAEFLHNVNYMLFLILADVLVGGVLYLVASLVPKHKQKLQDIGLKMLKEYFLMLIIFNSFNIAYSVGLQFTYSDTLVSVNTAVAVIALLLPIGAAIAVTVADPKQFGEFKNHYRRNAMSQLYFVCTIIFRMTLGVYMSQMNEVEQATIINFSISIVFMMYLITNTPYIQGYHNYRAIFDQAAIMISLFVAMYYRSMKSTTEISAYSQLLDPAALLVVVLYGSLGISAGCMGYEMYLKFRKQQGKPEEPIDEPVQQETVSDIHDNKIDSYLTIENVFNHS